jgi:ATP-dependent DNA helicase RecQ
MDYKEHLQKTFGINEFRGQQEIIIRRLLNNEHALVIMPTGSGKSITFQIPALIFDGLTIVISPLIALMKDQVDALCKKNVDAAYINASLTKDERQKRYQNLNNGKYKILYVTPERFRKPEFSQIITRRNISLLAIDEAHCISQWGHDFRPDYSRIKEFRKMIANPLTVALTATATPEVQEDIIQQIGLHKKEVKIFHEGIDRPNLFLTVQTVWGEQEKFTHIREIINTHPGSGIIYFVLINDLYAMSEKLQNIQVPHLIYHGELLPGQRKTAQDRFMQESNALILATNAFGMGIDKENIRFIIHAQIPASLEAYYQEIGRAGRDNKRSLCSLLYDQQDINIQMEFINWNNPSCSYFLRLYQILTQDIERVNGEGIEFLREQLVYKNRNDYRLETALGLLERYGVTEGDIADKSLLVISDLPYMLATPEEIEKKIKREQNRLYQMVLYTKETTCRKKNIHTYFGLDYQAPCNACDLEKSESGKSYIQQKDKIS